MNVSDRRECARCGQSRLAPDALELLLGDSLAGELLPSRLISALEGDPELAAAELLAQRELCGQRLKK